MFVCFAFKRASDRYSFDLSHVQFCTADFNPLYVSWIIYFYSEPVRSLFNIGLLRLLHSGLAPAISACLRTADLHPLYQTRGTSVSSKPGLHPVMFWFVSIIVRACSENTFQQLQTENSNKVTCVHGSCTFEKKRFRFCVSSFSI